MTAERIDRYGGRWPDRATLETIAGILWPHDDAAAEWSADTLDLIGAVMTDAGYRPDDEAPDDIDALADELATEYAAAVDRIRDRAIESRYGGRILRLLTVAPAPLYANLSDAERLALAESLALE